MFSIAEINCRFIDIHPCIGSILNAFHNQIYKPYPLQMYKCYPSHEIKYKYILQGHQLEHADKTKYLGVAIQLDFKGDRKLNNITTKANKTLGFLRRNINISSTTVTEQAYKSLVRPSLEYACSVWDPYTNENINQLAQVQRMVGRYVTKHCHNTSRYR